MVKTMSDAQVDQDCVFGATVSFRLTQQDLADILTAAIEGGIQYWASVEDYKWDGLPPQSMTAKVIPDDEKNVEHIVGVAHISTGISRLLAYSPQELEKKHVGGGEFRNDLALKLMNQDIGNIDAGDADIILQIALFDDARYG
jgi:hypothetical protein